MWYEGGAIGALLLLLAGLPVTAWILRTSVSVRPWLAGGLVASVFAASISYSLLSTWFISSFAITVMFCRFIHDHAAAAKA